MVLYGEQHQLSGALQIERFRILMQYQTKLLCHDAVIAGDEHSRAHPRLLKGLHCLISGCGTSVV